MLPTPARPGQSSGADGVRYTDYLWWSDRLPDAAAAGRGGRPVLAAGDLNEARAWDEVNEPET